MTEELKDIELYEFLGVLQSATTDEIKSAYRKKALKCHPDKNPDNPKAVELFHKLSKALEVLIDDSARAAYDKVLNGQKAAKLRHQELDSKRRKFKEELEAREREAELANRPTAGRKTKTPEEKLQAEIERLRKDGSRELKEEIELVRQQVLEESRLSGESDAQPKRLKVRWTSSKTDPSNGGYNSENLTKIFLKYGDIEALVISSKKNGSALVEFTTSEEATHALKYERGLPGNPLTLEWLEKTTTGTSNVANNTFISSDCSPNIKATNDLFTTANKPTLNTDFESLVLRQMRQAQERKRLIEQMKEEDTI